MKKQVFTTTIICCMTYFVVHGREVLPAMPALAVNNLWLCSDTLLSAATQQVVRAGSVVEIVSKSALEHLDKDQNQQFYWYQVKTRDGRRGWVLGDGLAIATTNEHIPRHLLSWHRKSVSLGAGFEDAQLWWAGIEGHDAQEFNLEFYGEYYLVITNLAGHSVFQKIGGYSQQGETRCISFFVQDLTADQHPELIIETSARERTQAHEWLPAQRFVEVLSIQNGSLRRLFFEKISLTGPDGLPAPALFKLVELENKAIRIEYLDFVECPSGDIIPAPAGEECLEFVTYTYTWNARTGQFEMMYEPTRLSPTAQSPNFGVALRLQPNRISTAVAVLGEGETVRVLRFSDQTIVENGNKKVESYFYVKTTHNYLGYVPASKLTLLKTRHADLLKYYIESTPLHRTLWQSDVPAVRLFSAQSRATQAGY